LQIKYLMKDLYLEYIKNTQNSVCVCVCVCVCVLCVVCVF
jgi:hypothetical protein